MLIRRRLATPLLLPGDVVVNHGMRVRIDGPAKVFHGGCDHSLRWTTGLHQTPEDPAMAEGAECPVGYAWPGTVINVEEACASGGVSRGMLKTRKFVEGHGWVTDRTDFWSVQGNRLAHWFVEREVNLEIFTRDDGAYKLICRESDGWHLGTVHQNDLGYYRVTLLWPQGQHDDRNFLDEQAAVDAIVDAQPVISRNAKDI